VDFSFDFYCHQSAHKQRETTSNIHDCFSYKVHGAMMRTDV